MYIGEWIGSSLGFIVVMLGAMGIAVGLVVHAALATMRGYVVDEAPEATPAVAHDERRAAPAAPAAPAPVRPAVPERVAVQVAD